jgi:type IV pilus assembly protein PilM
MPARQWFANLLQDPAPAYVFELSEAGIAMARSTARSPQIGFQPLDPDVLSVSPVRDNVLRLEALTAGIQTLAPRPDSRKRQRAVLILPDGSVRVAVLDFDAFPSQPDQQLSLVRFRLKKSLPYDVDASRLSYFAQPAGNGSRLDVVIAVTPLEIITRYEAPFRAAGFLPGLVTTSTLAALQLAPVRELTILVKLGGRILTISVLQQRVLKLLRSIELAGSELEEILGHLHPTLAYCEDQLAARPEIVLLCGFGSASQQVGAAFQAEFNLPVQPLRSRFGEPDQFNAGLLGCLESMGDSR